VEVVAEVVAADPRWTGQPILLAACNEFDNSDPTAGVFLPVLQLFADALQTRAPQWNVEAIGASGTVTAIGDGRLYPVSAFTVPGSEEIRRQTTAADRWFRVVGRRPGERVRPPQPLDATYASGGREFPSEVPAGVPGTRVPSHRGPDRSWPPALGSPLGWADRWAVRLALPQGVYDRLLGELRAEGVPADRPATRPEELVALRAYQRDPDGYDAAGGAGGLEARSIVRAASAAYGVVALPSAGAWVRPRVLVGAAEQAFGAAVGGWARGLSTPTVVVGVPGRPLPGFALPALQRQFAAMAAAGGAPARLLLAGWPTPGQRAWAERQVADFGVQVAYLDAAAQEAALADPAAVLSAAGRWTVVTSDAQAPYHQLALAGPAPIDPARTSSSMSAAGAVGGGGPAGLVEAHGMAVVHAGAPAPVDGYWWLTLVNPYRDQGGESATNCALTAIAVDRSLASGQLHIAGAAEPGWSGDVARYARRAPVAMPDYAAIVLELVIAGEGARGLVVVCDSADAAGHEQVLNVVYDGTRVVFLDGQTGGLARLPANPVKLHFTPTTAIGTTTGVETNPHPGTG